jgi:hypothetical protein
MCDAKEINDCKKTGVIKLYDRRGRVETYKGQIQLFCSELCANEYALEVSEGTWCPYPEASNALNDKQIAENKSYFRYDNQD